MNHARKVGQIKFVLRNIYISDFPYVLTLSNIKFLICVFYHNLIGISKFFRVTNQVVAGLCILWVLAAFFVNLLQCYPTEKLWSALGSEKDCWTTGSTWFALEFSTLLLDAALLCFPLVMIKRMKLSRAKQMSLAGMFLLGGFVCAMSIVKLAYVWRPTSSHHSTDLFPVALITPIQLGIAFMCACFPTCAPLFKFITGRRIRSTGHSSPRPAKNTRGADDMVILKHNTLDIELFDAWLSQHHGKSDSRIRGSESDAASSTADVLQTGKIYVRRSINVD